jgi:hypothetical protein
VSSCISISFGRSRRAGHFSGDESMDGTPASSQSMPMSLHPQELPAKPAETSRVTRAAYPEGSRCMRIADAQGLPARCAVPSVAVGTRVTPRPPLRSERALLTHSALALDV